MLNPAQSAIYFKGLNGVRAIASLIVVVSHVDQFSELFQIKSIGFYEHGMGGLAVDMFFVLSGFLITYLLFLEKNKVGKVEIKKFYLRRIFRIWPIYYLSIALSLLLISVKIIPSVEDLWASVGYYSFFMPNVAFVLNLSISSITPLWSVGVEEQFYLLWPHIINRSVNYLRVFIGFYLSWMILKLALYIFASPASSAYELIAYTRLNILCIGAMGAYLVHSKHWFLNIVYRKEAQIISWGILVYSVLVKPLHVFSFFDSDLNAIFYLVIILNVATNTRSLLSLDNTIMNFLGRISYGMYVYHSIIIFLVSQLFIRYHFSANHAVVYALIVAATIILSAFSYYYFEKWFLTLKKNYTIIPSSNTIVNSEP